MGKTVQVILMGIITSAQALPPPQQALLPFPSAPTCEIEKKQTYSIIWVAYKVSQSLADI